MKTERYGDGSGESRVKYVGKYRYVFRVFSLVFLSSIALKVQLKVCAVALGKVIST